MVRERKSKKSILFIALICCMFFSVFSGIVTADDSKKVFKLRFQSLYGANMMYQFDPLIKFCKEASNGRLIIEPYTSGQLVPNDQMLEAVAVGVLDMANGTGGYWANVMPVADIEGGLPFTFDTWADVNTFFYKRGFLELLREEYAKHGAFYIGPRTADLVYMQAKKPVATLSDIKKLKFRATSNMAKVLGGAGVSATYMAATEVYMGLSTGTLDGVVYGGAYPNYSLSFQEVAKYYMTPSVFCSVENMIINKKKWESMPISLQRILEMAVVYGSNQIKTIDWNFEYEYRKKMVDEHGVTIVKMEDDLVNALVDSSKKLWDEIAKKDEASAKGIAMLKEYLTYTGKLK